MTYFVACEVSGGLRPSEATVAVRNAEGGKAFLRVERDFLGEFNGRPHLPVGVIHLDPGAGKALIELPHEADSGVNRLWVYWSDLHQYHAKERAAV